MYISRNHQQRLSNHVVSEFETKSTIKSKYFTLPLIGREKIRDLLTLIDI